jgi:hypothetical protein
MPKPRCVTLVTDTTQDASKKKAIPVRQRGAALVELAFTLMVFLIFIFAIIEAAILIFRWAAANEAVRAGVRTAIVSSPVNTLYGAIDCSEGGSPRSVSYDCGGVTTGSCPAIVEEMQKFSPLVTDESVTVTYSCSSYKNPEDPRTIPRVTVSLDTEYKSVLLGAFGIDATVPLAPSQFQSSRIAEDLFSRDN